MKRKTSKLLTLLAASALTATAVTACSSNSGSPESAAPTATQATAEAQATSGPDISKKVELVWYLVGEPHKDTQKVVEEWNTMLQKDLNTTVKLNFTTWNDWETKYNLLLTSGEKIDMIFASSWAGFYKYAKQGAFLDLKEMLPKDAPLTWQEVPKQDWSDVTLGDNIYAVPSTFAEYTPNGLVYREDWRKKFNLPEIKDLDSLEAYMDGVKKNLPDVTPISGKAINEINTLYLDYHDFKTIGGDTDGVIVASSYDKPRDVVAAPFTPQFAEWVKKMKSWADKGYWSKNTLSSKQEAGDFIPAGKGAIYWRNPSSAGGFINNTKLKYPDIELAYFPFTRFHNYAIPNLSINNGMAIPKSSQNPDRSLMVLDKLRNDPKYFNLMTYGIEGLHYDIASDPKHIVVPAKGQDPKVVTPYDIASWGWRYEPNMKTTEGGWDGFDKLTAEFKAETKPNIFAPIYLDYDPVKTELAAVHQVYEQYGQPLMLGLVPDVDKALQTYQDKLKQAGVDKLLDYIKQQATAYYDEKGVQ